ncbi:MAG: YceI family protein [Bdellovibrionia bacterium]
MKLLLTLTTLILTATQAHAEPQTFQATARPDGSTGVVFKLPYTGGTHTGLARKILGAIRLDPANLAATTGKIQVPIANIVTGDAKRDCHMRESLGLNYDVSKFPEVHVCDANQNLAPTGPDSIIFPTVDFEISGVAVPNGTVLRTGQPVTAQVRGRFTIHGVAREISLPAVVTLTTQNELTVQTKGGLKLADFGIIVKKFLFITVGEAATLDLNLSFTRVQ